MKCNRILIGAVSGLLATQSSTAVTLTFDSDLEGFTAAGNASELTHSAFGGGSMALTVAGGWTGNSAQLSLQSNPALWSEIQQATLSGGTLSFTLSIDTTASNGALSVSGTAPTWLQPVITGNSAGTGGWDQNTMANDNLAAATTWPTASSIETISVSLPIAQTASGSVANDEVVFVDTAPGWSNIHFGMNTEGAAWASDYTVYIDNLSIVAVPEPSSALLTLVGALGLIRRRR